MRDVHLARGGVCRYHLYVQIAKRQEGEAKNMMMGAFAGHYDVKHVIVVDEDVDIHDPAEVEWAVATRFQADRDLVIVPESQGSKLDPSTRDGVGAKMGLDATKPLDAEEMKFKRIRVPGEDGVRSRQSRRYRTKPVLAEGARPLADLLSDLRQRALELARCRAQLEKLFRSRGDKPLWTVAN